MEHPTIRQLISTQVWKQTGLFFAGAIAVVASTLLFPPHVILTRDREVLSWALMGVGFIAFVGGVIGTQFARCPKCSMRLGSFGTQVAYGSVAKGERCPYCGVGLDESAPPRKVAA